MNVTPPDDEFGEAAAMIGHGAEAAEFLKAIAHEGRLMILCHLADGEKSVSELEHLLHARQSAVSQQLTRLRLEGIVSCRREGKTIHYSLTDPRARRILETIHGIFCAAAEDGAQREG